MKNLTIKRTHYIELLVPKSGNLIKFSRETILEGKKIEAIIGHVNGTTSGTGASPNIYPTAAVPNPPFVAPVGEASSLISPNKVRISALTQSAYLTLVDGENKKLVDRLPYFLLDPKKNNVQDFIPFDISQQIDWEKSFVEIVYGPDGSAPAHEVGLAIPFWVAFSDRK